MLDDFAVRAALAALGVALAAAPLGCFVVWRRMAYFGDATAHAGVLGVAIGLWLSVPVGWTVLAASLAMALVVTRVARGGLGVDAALGVASHAALAAGLVAASLAPGRRPDLLGYLVGDVLAVSRADLGLIWGGAALVTALIAWRWRALVLSTLSPELAHAAGIRPERESLILTLALALAVAVAIDVVGVLPIAALLVIPAAAARPLAREPESMALWAAGIGAVSAVGGIAGAFAFDTPAGPSVVCAAALLFVLTRPFGRA